MVVYYQRLLEASLFRVFFILVIRALRGFLSHGIPFMFNTLFVKCISRGQDCHQNMYTNLTKNNALKRGTKYGVGCVNRMILAVTRWYTVIQAT